ncbi:helix-turn-helix domain-containing protein [Salinicoccus roseus]|uniref:helix-turn-helix domain-containing protein n=1 Tax=Salinicoccus roseus TaxID=45670 RepID=UPI00374327E0
MQDIKPSVLKLWLLMYSLSDDSGAVSISYSHITESTGMARTTISRAIKELVDKELLEIKPNRGISSEYKIIIPAEYKQDKRYTKQ